MLEVLNGGMGGAHAFPLTEAAYLDCSASLRPRSTSILSTGALRQAHLLLRGRCRPTVTFQAFMLGCGTEKMLLSRGNNVGPVGGTNSSQVSNGILRARGVSEKLLFSDSDFD